MKPLPEGHWGDTPGQQFVKQCEQAGHSTIYAYRMLLLSDIPLDPLDRHLLAYMLLLMVQPGPRGMDKVNNELFAEVRKVRRSELRKQGIVGLQAEEIIAAEEGAPSIGALRKRATRANQRRRK